MFLRCGKRPNIWTICCQQVWMFLLFLSDGKQSHHWGETSRPIKSSEFLSFIVQSGSLQRCTQTDVSAQSVTFRRSSVLIYHLRDSQRLLLWPRPSPADFLSPLQLQPLLSKPKLSPLFIHPPPTPLHLTKLSLSALKTTAVRLRHLRTPGRSATYDPGHISDPWRRERTKWEKNDRNESKRLSRWSDEGLKKKKTRVLSRKQIKAQPNMKHWLTEQAVCWNNS